MAEKRVSPEEIERIKQWAMIKFREILRGARITEQITRWAAGELGEYRFNINMVLNDEAKKFIDDRTNAEKLSQEKLV